jgi:hypothetical protein
VILLAVLWWSILSEPATAGVSTISWVVPLVIGLFSSGGAVAIFQWLSHRGKSAAEAAEIWTKASVTRLSSMYDEMGRMQDEMDTLHKRVRLMNSELESERQKRIDADHRLAYALRLLTDHGIDYTAP